MRYLNKIQIWRTKSKVIVRRKRTNFKNYTWYIQTVYLSKVQLWLIQSYKQNPHSLTFMTKITKLQTEPCSRSLKIVNPACSHSQRVKMKRWIIKTKDLFKQLYKQSNHTPLQQIKMKRQITKVSKRKDE